MFGEPGRIDDRCPLPSLFSILKSNSGPRFLLWSCTSIVHSASADGAEEIALIRIVSSDSPTATRNFADLPSQSDEGLRSKTITSTPEDEEIVTSADSYSLGLTRVTHLAPSG